MIHPAKKLVNQLIEDQELTQDQLGERLGVKQSRVSKILNSEFWVKAKSRKRVAEVFGMTLTHFDEQWTSKAVPQQIGDPDAGIPILGEIPAGDGSGQQWAYDSGVGDGYITRASVGGVEDPLAFAVKIDGDSMAPSFIEGDMVICTPTIVKEKGFEEGEVYAIRFDSSLDDEATIKRVHIVSTKQIELLPDNPDHEPRTVNADAIIRAAKVVKIISNPKPMTNLDPMGNEGGRLSRPGVKLRRRRELSLSETALAEARERSSSDLFKAITENSNLDLYVAADKSKTKQELIDKIADATGVKNVVVSKIISNFLNRLKDQCANDDKQKT